MTLSDMFRYGIQHMGLTKEDSEIITSNSFLSSIKLELLTIILFTIFYFLPLEKIINVLFKTNLIFIWKIILFFIIFAIIIRTQWFKNL
jgi:hypothetical protein